MLAWIVGLMMASYTRLKFGSSYSRPPLGWVAYQLERSFTMSDQRVDDNDGDNLAVAGLLGAMSRLLGKSPDSYRERDDVAAGVLIRYQMSPEYQREQETRQLLAELLASGMSPDDAKTLMGGNHK
jgi:hypothetical protein